MRPKATSMIEKSRHPAAPCHTAIRLRPRAQQRTPSGVCMNWQFFCRKESPLSRCIANWRVFTFPRKIKRALPVRKHPGAVTKWPSTCRFVSDNVASQRTCRRFSQGKSSQSRSWSSLAKNALTHSSPKSCRYFDQNGVKASQAILQCIATARIVQSPCSTLQCSITPFRAAHSAFFAAYSACIRFNLPRNSAYQLTSTGLDRSKPG
jgi:hypothetical protein